MFLLALAASATTSAPPPTQNTTATARWLAAHLAWGVLSTTSTRSDGTVNDAAFGNPYSYADVGGVPYLYVSELDVSVIDLQVSPKASLALSEASLKSANGTATLSACEIGAGLGDPENPPCARFVLSGTMSKVPAGSEEETVAKQALFARHPSFANFPDDHSFYVAKMTVTGLWLIDFYGGAAIIAPADYFSASAAFGAPPRGRTIPLLAAKNVRVRSSPPPFWQKAKTARWMVSTLEWGGLSTTSTRTKGTTIGAPFGNPYSFADVNGVPYVYASDLDASMTDLFIGAGANTTATLALSEAGLPGIPIPKCEIGTALGDPENPPCARLVLTATMSKVPAGSDEETAAKEALFARHPSFASFPPGHGFYVAKLDVTGIWLIDMYGGAAIIKPSDYFAAEMVAPSPAGVAIARV